MPPLARQCIASWHSVMPNWEYRLWDETNFDIDSVCYAQEAYASGKYAFLSDYVRLWALEREGGLYLDVDFEVYRPFDNLTHYHAFAGFEGSKHHPLMMGVCASEAHGQWVTEMLNAYHNRHFLLPNGLPDTTTNVQFITALMTKNGFRQDGTEQEYYDLHVFPTDYFSPRQTTGEYFRTANTYCEHRSLSSWNTPRQGWKTLLLKAVGEKNKTHIIKLKRKILG